MLLKEDEIRQKEVNFYKDLIRLYLKYGSVEKVFRYKKFNIPISYPGLHHLISKWGVIKSVGPNSMISETISFLENFTSHKLSIGAIYKKMPLQLKTSLTTAHRILHNIKMGVVRRFGTALVLVKSGKILLGFDVKNNALTLPMTYSKKNEDPRLSIKRVFQQEVFSENVVNRNFPNEVIPKQPKVFMHLMIGDIQVSVYIVNLKKNYIFTSEKVTNHNFYKSREILNSTEKLRLGVLEIVNNYEKYLYRKNIVYTKISDFNLALIGA